jgi:hypothetical protein
MAMLPNQEADAVRSLPRAAVPSSVRPALDEFSTAVLAELVRAIQANPNANSAPAIEELARSIRALSRTDWPLGIEEVAELCRCTVDTVRRIPVEQLPRYQVGREVVFQKHEILQFIVTYRSVQPSESRLASPRRRRPSLEPDGGRGRDSHKGRAS